MKNTWRLALALLVSMVLMMTSALAQTSFRGGWPYQLPPDGHFNSFAVGAITLGIYQNLMEPSLATYIWADGEYEGMLAESFGFDDDDNYVVTLKDGVTWSDGTPLSADDVIATFNVGYLLNFSVWETVADIERVDDRTVRFVMDEPSFAGERNILVAFIRPHSVYGDIAERAAELRAEGLRSGDDAFNELLDELTRFRPEQFVAVGPYQLLSENISDAQVRLVRNEGGLNADIVQFDEVILWNGETEAVTPLVSSGELYYGTYGFPPATEAAFVQQGIDIIRGPSYSGPGLYFNHSVYPFDRVEVRQAIAHAIDRDENGFVSLGESGVAVEFMAGLSDNLLPLYVSDDVLDSLNTYDYNPEGAAELLESIGFSRGADGVWVDDQGNRMAFELIFPAEFADWAAAAENAAQALNAFGIQITARGVQFQQQQQDVYDSNFQLAIRNWGIANPFPYESFNQPFVRYNGQGELAGEGAGGGMRFDTTVTFSGGTIDLVETAIASSQGLDADVQAELITQLVVAFNELLPAVPLWERYGNNPLNRNFLSAPEGDDPIYNNAGNADHFMPYLILTGQIGPAQ
jgi:peptide/nickel transport system substrate-binding protein